MIGDGDEGAGDDLGVERAAGVREDEAADPEAAEHANTEDDLRRLVTLVEMRAPLEHGHRDTAERAHHERPCVPDGGRRRANRESRRMESRPPP